MNLRRRVAFTAAAAVAVAVALGSLVAYLVVRDTLRGQIDASLKGPASGAAGLSMSVAPPPGAEPLEHPSVFFQRVVGDRLIAASGEQQRLGDPKQVQEVADGTRPAFFGDTEVDGVHVRYYTQRAEDGTAVQVARPMTEVDDALSKLRLGLGLVSVAGIALAAFGARLATRHAVRPVTNLTETAEHVARTRDLSRRIEASGDDELARLAASFNTMLEALDDSQRAQRRLVADASHELRTPLTSLRTNSKCSAAAASSRRPTASACAATSSPSSRSSASSSATSSSSRATARRRRSRPRPCGSTSWSPPPSSARAGTRPRSSSRPSWSRAWWPASGRGWIARSRTCSTTRPNRARRVRPSTCACMTAS